MKKLVALAFALLTAGFVFAQSAEYTTALNKAKTYEGQKRWAYALGSYYDAIMASDDASLKQEAMDGYNALADVIKAGNPGTGRYNAFAVHDEWKNLLLDAEKYGTEYGRFNISLGDLEMGTLNYTSRTATYTAEVTITDSDRYRKVIGVIQQGYKAAYKNDWTDLPLGDETYSSYAWPLVSSQKPSGSSFLLNNVAIFALPRNGSTTNYDYYNAFALYSLGVKSETSSYYAHYTTLYDLKLNIVDNNGTELVGAKRFLLDGAGGYDRSEYWDDYSDSSWTSSYYSHEGLVIKTTVSFDGISATIMDKIDAGEAHLNVTNLYLEYGKYNKTDDAGGRKFIKNFPEVSIPLTKTCILGSNGNDIYKTRFEDVAEYRKAGASMALVNNYLDFVTIEGRGAVFTMEMARIETPQRLFQEVMGFNPSNYKSDYAPVTNVSWYDAIYFCNKLSVMQGYTPCYTVSGVSDVNSWNYTPGRGDEIYGTVAVDNTADGYRLPTREEWRYVASASYEGNPSVGDYAWFDQNSPVDNGEHHPTYVGQKLPNTYGVYDIYGNVREWVNDAYSSYSKYHLGGYYNSSSYNLNIDSYDYDYSENRYSYVGFRVIRSHRYEQEAQILARSKTLVDNFYDFAVVEGSDSVYSFTMSKIEVPQSLFLEVMGFNNSAYKGANVPVNNVSWYDAIYFCNKLSELNDMEPVYKVNGSSNVATWNYTPGRGNSISGTVSVNNSAVGFRLPTAAEWRYAAKGGNYYDNYSYSGSNTIDDIAWYSSNSFDAIADESAPHTVGLKLPNSLGIYDMTGNVREWVWDEYSSYSRYHLGGGFNNSDYNCEISSYDYDYKENRYSYVGFRVIISSRAQEELVRKAPIVEIVSNFRDNMIAVPGTNVLFAPIEVPQSLYEEVMGVNPSWYSNDLAPVSNVSWYDAVYFCNLLSLRDGLTPCYSINGNKDVSTWGYTPNTGYDLNKTVACDENASGYRLPTKAEWTLAAQGGDSYSNDSYSGGNNIDTLAWYDDNSYNDDTGSDAYHEVATKAPNALGIYDLTGNVREWVYDAYSSYSKYHLGGSYYNSYSSCRTSSYDYDYSENRYNYVGFRIVRRK